MRLLLVNPEFPESFWTFRWAIEEVLPGKRAVNPPLGLATLAALCPPDWQVEIVDENVEALPLDCDADIVGVCGMGVQAKRQRELLAHYRARGHYVVAGGSYASLCPEEYVDHADTVVAGEAEYIWPAFCADYQRGRAKPLYRETGTVALGDSPVPRFDLLKLGLYSNVTLQYSRGCPFRCEFCDIIVMFGRKPRVKTTGQIGRELNELRRLGARNVFFVDDNLIGNRPQAKQLLRFLRDYQDRHGYAFSFGTEASLDMAQDPELLELFRAAGFGWVFIGIESPDPASLKETLKVQNLREDPLDAVRRIYAHGIDVLAGFIVGFDNDTLDTFDKQYSFITQAGIQSAMIGLLMALPRTPLHERMAREGRLRESETLADNTRPHTNIIPLRMDPAEMAAHYVKLYRRLLDDRAVAERIRNKLRHLVSPIYRSGYGFRDRAGILVRLVGKGILPGGPRRWAAFLGTFPFLRPSRLPLVAAEWIIALSMRAFAERHLSPTVRAAEEPGQLAALRRAMRGQGR
ncbi:MAG: radical SAM protein [Actinomycetota bacterium]